MRRDPFCPVWRHSLNADYPLAMAKYLLLFGLIAAGITWKLFYEGFQPGFQRSRGAPPSPLRFLATFLIVLSLLIGLVLLLISIPYFNPINN
jgi:uncharacterized membrane protein YphA (DoxX/SURF4 family)